MGTKLSGGDGLGGPSMHRHGVPAQDAAWSSGPMGRGEQPSRHVDPRPGTRRKPKARGRTRAEVVKARTATLSAVAMLDSTEVARRATMPRVRQAREARVRSMATDCVVGRVQEQGIKKKRFAPAIRVGSRANQLNDGECRRIGEFYSRPWPLAPGITARTGANVTFRAGFRTLTRQ